MTHRGRALTLTLTLVTMGALVSACSDQGSSSTEPGSSAPTSTAPATPASAPTPATRRNAREIVEDNESILELAYVRRDRSDIEVRTMWRVPCPGDSCRKHAVVTSSDGFENAEYSRGGQVAMLKLVNPPRPLGVRRHEQCVQVSTGVDLCDNNSVARWTANGGRTWQRRSFAHMGLLSWPTPSLAPDTLAIVFGGDGATLFPFERVARSTNAGATWTNFELPRLDNERAYSSGHVVTSEGRLLALLDHFSDDRAGRPSDRWHGLYASDRFDWSSYTPMDPEFSPELAATPQGWSPIVSLQASSDPDPVIWVTTWDRLLYVSTDDGARFRQIPAR